MKEHFCPAEKSMITYQSKCNWCGEKEWVNLTDEEIDEAINSCKTLDTRKYFRAVEAKLKEKNT
jgi:hypothetical protein